MRFFNSKWTQILLILFVVLQGYQYKAQEEDTEDFVADGKTYRRIDGNIYSISNDGSTGPLIVQLYDPEYFEKHYKLEGDRIFRIVPDGNEPIEVYRSFHYDFEKAMDARGILAVPNKTSGWTKMTLQSPLAPKVSDYNALAKHVFKFGDGFLDNRVEPSDTRAHNSNRSLRCYSVSPSKEMITAKASLSTELVHFTNGDKVRYVAWYFLEKGRPTSIVDIESTWLHQYGGIRIMLDQNYHLWVELKFLGKPNWKQDSGKQVEFPTGKWVKIQWDLVLSETAGSVELRQDDVLILKGKGRTLPLSDIVYNNLEVGISANPVGEESVLYVDDISISVVEK